MKILVTALLMMLSYGFEFDSTVHDFGTVSVDDGCLSCTFTMKNTGDEPITILAVTSSCGCTRVTWTKETIQPGEEGKVSATYSNDEGPYPFDKTLAVYVTGSKKPAILHLRGIVRK